MVLAAGYGTRLGSLTERCPKGLLEVGEYCLLELVIARLADYGISEIAVNLHFKPDMIRDRLGDGSTFGVALEYSSEPDLLGTAGAVRAMRHFFDDGRPFLIHYGDVITDQNFDTLLRVHLKRRALVTLLVHKRIDSNSLVVMDKDHRITSFLERPHAVMRTGVVSCWVNSGICICEPEVFEYFPEEQPLDLPADVFPRLVETGAFFGHPINGYRCAVDSAVRLAALRSALADGRYIPPLALLERKTPETDF